MGRHKKSKICNLCNKTIFNKSNNSLYCLDCENIQYKISKDRAKLRSNCSKNINNRAYKDIE